MANLPLAFAGALTGGLLLATAVTDAQGDPLNVLRGKDAGVAGFAGATAQGGSGGATGGVLAPVGPGGLVNPLAKAKGVVWERTDQGVDASALAGSPVLAMGDGTITNIIPDWYSGQPAIIEQLSNGKIVGYAEQLAPNVSIGDHVQAGQQIATVAQSGTGMEFFFAADKAGTTLAKATTGYVEGQVTQAGLEMRALLKSLGAAV